MQLKALTVRQGPLYIYISDSFLELLKPLFLNPLPLRILDPEMRLDLPSLLRWFY